MGLQQLTILFAVLVGVSGFLLLAGLWAQLTPPARVRKVPCRYCGTQVPPGADACPYCGREVQG